MKNLTKKNLLFVILIAILISGSAKWENAKGLQKIDSQKVSINLGDKNWHAFNDEANEMYSLTKDGVLLQHILIRRVELDKALISSKKAIKKDILPHELSELIIEDLKVANEMNSFKIISNVPEQIDTKDGIQIVSQMKDEFDNLIKVNSTYFIHDEKLYMITYLAPNQHFYDRDISNYEYIKKSIKLNL